MKISPIKAALLGAVGGLLYGAVCAAAAQAPPESTIAFYVIAGTVGSLFVNWSRGSFRK